MEQEPTVPPNTPEPGLPALWRRWRATADGSQGLDRLEARHLAALALDYGEAFMAYDFTVAGLRQGSDVHLLQQQALALARTGSTQRAQAILEELRRQGQHGEETLGLLASTYKDLYWRESDIDRRTGFLQSSLALYKEAYARTGSYYSGINLATLLRLAGNQAQALSLAREIQKLLLRFEPGRASSVEEQFWRRASLAEASLLLGQTAEARSLYRSVVQEFCGRHIGAILRVREQASRLADTLLGDPQALAGCFDLGQVAAFAGHMFDQPGRRQPRLPYAAEPELRALVEAALRRLDVRYGYSSLASGADLLFAEALLARQGQLHLVLPFQPEEFIAVSVNVVPGVDFRPRFQAVLDRAASVSLLSDWPSSHDAVAFIFAFRVLNGLALIKSRLSGLPLVPVAVWDGRPCDGGGGVEGFVQSWRSYGLQPVIVPPPPEAVSDACPAPPPQPACNRDAPTAGARTILAMLFADVVGYSKLSDPQTLLFVDKVLNRIAATIHALPSPPVFINTWGDAVFAAFEEPECAGRFALQLRDLFRGMDWRGFGFGSELQIRIGLHAGPVYTCFNPVLRQTACTGAHVNRAARIEPITEEGQVFASATFAALAETNRVSAFALDYAGTRPLAKKHEALPVFLLRWR
ncbi:MAG: TRAFs-binding domain-containing protein [Limisphaerales bacterium]